MGGDVGIYGGLMAILFDEVNDYYSIPDNAVLTLPNGDWCIGLWLKVDDNTGTNFQYFLSNNGTLGGSTSLNFYIYEDSASPGTGDPGDYIANIAGNSLVSSSSYGADGVWRLWIFQRTPSLLEWWSCAAGAGAVLEDSVAIPITSIDSWNPLNVGRRQDGNADRYYGGQLAELFKGDFSLSQSEIEAIASGWPPFALGKTLDVYLPMQTAAATLQDWFSGLTATRNDAPTTVEHPPVKWWPQMIGGVAATGASITALLKIFSENADIDSTTPRRGSLFRQLAEANNIGEASQILLAMIREQAETIDVGEAKNKVAGFIKRVAEGVNIGEVLVKLSGVVKLLSETFYIKDTLFDIDGDANLEGLWDFEDLGGDLGIDSSANSNDMVNYNNVYGTMTQDGTAQRGDYSAYFGDESFFTTPIDSDFLYIPSASQIGLDITGELTVGTWVKIDYNPTGAIAYLVARDSAYILFASSSPYDRAGLILYLNGSGYNVLSSASGDMTIGDWHFVVGTWDGTEVRIYIDGALSNSNSIGVDTIVDSGGDISLGNIGGASSYTVPGFLDYSFILSRSLTAGEISALYTQQKTLYFRTMKRFEDVVVNLVEAFISPKAMKRLLAGVVNIGETTIRLSPLSRIISDVINIATILATFFGVQVTKIFNETIYLLEEIVYENALVRAIAEAVNISEAKEQYLGFIKAKAETVNIDETAAEFPFLLKIISEVVRVAHSHIRAAAFVRPISDAIQIADSILNKIGLRVVWNELVFVTETKASILGLLKLIAETVNINTAATRVTGLYQRIAEAVQVGNTRVLAKGIVKILSEAVQIASDSLRTISLKRQIAEYVRINSAQHTPKQLGRIIENQVNLNESVLEGVALRRLINEAIDISGTRFIVRGLTRAANEVVNIAESFSHRLALLVVIVEYVELNTVSTRARTMAREQADRVWIYTTRLKPFAYTRQAVEAVQVISTAILLKPMTRLIDEAVRISAAALTLFGLVRNVAEAVNISPAIARLMGQIRALGETVQISASVLNPRNMGRLVADTVRVIESITRAISFNRLVDEAVNIIEDTIIVRAFRFVIGEVVQIQESIADAVPTLYTLKNLSRTGVAIITSRKSMAVYLGRKAISILSNKKGVDID